MLLIRLGLLPVNIGFDVVANQPDTPRYFVAANVRLTDIVLVTEPVAKLTISSGVNHASTLESNETRK